MAQMAVMNPIGTSLVRREHSRGKARASPHFARYVTIGMIPLVALAVAYLLGLSNIARSHHHVYGLLIPVALTLTLTFAFSFWALRLYYLPIHLPFVWAFLFIVEFVVSPAVDVLLGAFELESLSFVRAFERANWVAALFVAGVWIGTIIARRIRSAGRFDADTGNPGWALIPLLVLFIAISGVTQVHILSTSGALTGDLAGARGEGLIGTSALTPLVRLADVSSLVASWYSVRLHDRKKRGVFQRLSVLSLCVALLMPIALGQRVSVMVGLAFFAAPRIAFGVWLRLRLRRWLLLALPVVITGAFGLNIASLALRSYQLRGESFGSFAEVKQEFKEIGRATHFRHLYVLTLLLRGGVDDGPNGGYYDGNPLIGDVLIVLPRKFFPEKPITSLGVVNAIVLGRRWSASDRGSASTLTASLWNQLYVAFGIAGILPGALVFGCVSMLLWSIAAGRADRPEFAVLAIGAWLIFGWLAMNAALTSIEVPGLLLGSVGVAIARRTGHRPGTPRWGVPGGVKLAQEPVRQGAVRPPGRV